jgi:hypothetical protein
MRRRVIQSRRVRRASPGPRRLGLVAIAAIALAVLLGRLLGNPDVRAGITWAARSWFVPPDAAAGWEQGRG